MDKPGRCEPGRQIGLGEKGTRGVEGDEGEEGTGSVCVCVIVPCEVRSQGLCSAASDLFALRRTPASLLIASACHPHNQP